LGLDVRSPACGPEVPPGDAPLEAIAERYALPLEALDGWTIAVNLTRSGCRINDVGLRVYAERLAARAVLQRATRLVGPLRSATVQVREPLREPHAGELDVETTLANIAGKPYPEADDWVGVHREERRQQVVLMVDTSLSMSGENMAIAAVAAAVLALKIHPEDLSVVVFEDTARAVTRLHSADPPVEVVRRMLDQPVRGYTNIRAAPHRPAHHRRGRHRGGRPRPGCAPVPAALRAPDGGLQDGRGFVPPAGGRGPRRRLPGAHVPRTAAAPARCRQSRAALDCRLAAMRGAVCPST
jgi:hypothetical protein